MERYEINKYFQSFEQKIKDMYIALDIEKNIPKLQELEEKISAVDFWQDIASAQAVIAESNKVKSIVEGYKSLESGYKDLIELDSLSEIDEDAFIMLESEILSFDKTISEFEINVILSGEYDDCDAILELHPGAGGTESMDWADMLYRMYTRYCARKNLKVKVLDYLPGEDAGLKSVTISVSGKYAYGLLKSERGVHRLVRISPFDSNAKRHTSFASCDIAPQIEETNNVIINDEDLKIDVYHSSGAGGQSVNTTDSAVRMTHKPTGIVVTCQNERSQIKNREVALKILKSKLLELEIRKKEEELRKIKGEQMDIGFGSQIRSYVFHPYSMVKDHRTLCETGNIQAVMDGQIEEFVNAYLKFNARS